MEDKAVRIAEILSFLNKIEERYSFNGDENDVILGYSSLYEYKSNTITWLRSNENYKAAKETIFEPMKLIVAPEEFPGYKDCSNCIKTEDPHRVFFYILKEFFSEEEHYGIGKNNIISPSAIIADHVFIGNNCVIGERSEIGEGSRIYDNVVIGNDVKIGKNALVQSGAVIGEEGFGFLTDKNQKRDRVMHFGRVIMGDDVEIGANTCIARGVMEDTVISDGSKIDNLCHIGHNVKIGKNAFIVAHTMVGGSVTIGDNCWLATSVIRNGICIGDNALVGMGAVVVKDVRAGAVVYGNPAKEANENK
ncbi:MAG: UDP-3-O-(3-hydroxymyristoyl)glucosamine N-acyltransferase [Candidatus Eremiobacterota bacterium]